MWNRPPAAPSRPSTTARPGTSPARWPRGTGRHRSRRGWSRGCRSAATAGPRACPCGSPGRASTAARARRRVHRRRRPPRRTVAARVLHVAGPAGPPAVDQEAQPGRDEEPQRPVVGPQQERRPPRRCRPVAAPGGGGGRRRPAASRPGRARSPWRTSGSRWRSGWRRATGPATRPRTPPPVARRGDGPPPR